MTLKNCSTCGRQTKEYVEFPCMNCGQDQIVRCHHCREIINPYTCKRCGKEGP